LGEQRKKKHRGLERDYLRDLEKGEFIEMEGRAVSLLKK